MYTRSEHLSTFLMLENLAILNKKKKVPGGLLVKRNDKYLLYEMKYDVS